MSHASHLSGMAQKSRERQMNPEPSKFYLEIKDKYDIKTEYIKRYGSTNAKWQTWDIARLWVEIIQEKLDEEDATISYEIYKECLKRLWIANEYEIKFLCLVIELIYPKNQVLGEKIWKDILKTVDSFSGVGDYTFSPIIDFVETSIKLNKIDDNKKLITNAIKGAMRGSSEERLNELLSEIEKK